MTEIWKETKYRGYEVSNYGQVRSFFSSFKYQTLGDKPRILKPQKTGRQSGKSPSRYLTVGVGPKKMEYVHRLVMETFTENTLDKPTINHKDGDKGNNRLNNLEWATYAENHQHAYKIGLRTPKKLYSDVYIKYCEVCNEIFITNNKNKRGCNVKCSYTLSGISHSRNDRIRKATK